ncbi:MAG: FIST N-terminal domain-containing protein [Bradyrhizobium sp.]
MVETEGRVAESVVVAQAKAASPREAAESIASQFASAELAMVVVFVSPFYDPQSFIREITERMPDTPVFGCTTAGELAPQGWDEDSVVALGFDAKDFIISACALPELSSFRVDHGRALCGDLHREFNRRTEHCDARYGSFGLLFIDGMCQREEAVISTIYGSLEDMPVIGGSAGDGLRFERSWVFHEGNACTDTAVLILIKTRLPFRLFKCDHFEPTSTKMVVTEADIERRIVKEINAEPAALEYSRAVGLGDTKLDAFSFAAHPVLVRVGGAYYARSIQRMDPDGSLHFFCAIDEGMVLTVARAIDPVDSTKNLLDEIKSEMGEVSIFIGFECVLRRLDVEQHQLSREMSDLYRRNNVIGFHTYGEQYHSMHVNQTLTGVAIGRRAKP